MTGFSALGTSPASATAVSPAVSPAADSEDAGAELPPHAARMNTMFSARSRANIFFIFISNYILSLKFGQYF
jgi:hypothetical protein